MRSLVNKILNARLAAAALTVAFGGAAVAQTPSASPQEAPRETPPAPAAPRPVNLPSPVERTLANGLRVIVVEDPGSPLVSATLLVKNGGEVDPNELSGVADMTASLLTKGTKKRTAPQIAQDIEALGGSIASGAGWDASTASVNVMSSKAPTALEILSDVVLNPTFADEEIERLRQQYIDGLTVALQNPGTLAGYVASRVVFGDQPYGHPVSGTLESLARIKRDDIARVHSAYYRPDNAVLVFGGDIRAADAYKLAETHFGAWAKPATPLPAASRPASASAKPRVVVVDMPNAGQAAVLLARTGLSRNDPDYFRGIVTNSVLSGYSGRLNQEIRIKRGLSYGARSQLDTRRHTGPFIASAQTKNPSGAEVAALLVGEISRLAKEPVTETELTPRKAVLIGNFARNLETTEGLVAQVASLALHGLSLGEINNYIRNVQSITGADIQQFATKRLAASEANIIIVGNAKDFIEPLRKQFPDVEVIPAAELDLNRAALRKPAATTPGNN
ncbi:MAG TPA: pitrilysin family protein [Pyrinomonadaceae bacterium]|nr:pitrilysin family protein [Pyrinomonadaceae bacterium]